MTHVNGLHQMTACSHCHCSWIVIQVISTAAAALQLPERTAAKQMCLWGSDLLNCRCTISRYLAYVTFTFGFRQAQWNAADVIRIHFVIWCDLWCVYCHGNWGQMQTCKTSRVSVLCSTADGYCFHTISKRTALKPIRAQNIIRNKHLSICTSLSSCFSCTFLPNITLLFSIPSNLASACHHRDLELAPTVARQQWQEAFSFNYVRVCQVNVLCCI